ncbi:MAG TPA: PhnD/SsuA/transferrin family substrate-binding protein [bacterium]|jgi:ABC-type phosphate/phosphonate transport system substrate-binding protein
MNDSTLILGAVAYDPKVVTIWNGFRDYFRAHGLAFDYILFSNYERQVQAHFAGVIHVAWNSPLAWLQSQQLAASRGRRAEAICMRDSDRDLTSVVLVRADSAIATVTDLTGKRVAVGAKDSPQATLIPLEHLSQAGLKPNTDFAVISFEVLVGLHGDHIGGERDAVGALLDGTADAACILEGNHAAFLADGTLPSHATRILSRTTPFDHCNFTVLDGAPAEQVNRFRELLLAMSYADPQVKPLLDLEGLKCWKPGRTSGYAVLTDAVERFGTLREFVRSSAAAIPS